MKKISERIEVLRNKIQAIIRLQRLIIFKIKKCISGSIEALNLFKNFKFAEALEEKLQDSLSKLERKLVL